MPFPILAAGIEQLIVLVAVAAAYAIKNFLENRAGKSGAPPPTDPFGKPSQPGQVLPPKKAAPPPQPATLSRPGGAEAQSEEEKMRRFFEALGLPSDALPPAPVVTAKEKPPEMPAPKELARPKASPPPLKRVPPPFQTSFPDSGSLDSDPSPSVLAGDMHRVDPRYDYATVTADFRGAAKLETQSKGSSTEVDVRPDLLGASPEISRIATASNKDARSLAYEVARSFRADPAALRRALIMKEILDQPVSMR